LFNFSPKNRAFIKRRASKDKFITILSGSIRSTKTWTLSANQLFRRNQCKVASVSWLAYHGLVKRPHRWPPMCRRRHTKLVDKIRKLKAVGKSVREIAEEAGTSRSTVQRLLAAA
jgi:hypothetical protein